MPSSGTVIPQLPRNGTLRAGYTSAFFEAQRSASGRSAEQVVPVVCQLVRPASVIDVGCGVGAWLAVFRAHGVSRILGVDGDYVDRRMLVIPEDVFTAHD